MPELTHKEWQDSWRATISRMRFQEGMSFSKARSLAYRETEVRYGPEPGKPQKPPLWIRASSHLGGEGEAIMGLWNWLNGRKTVIGALLVTIPVVWNGIQPVLEAGGVSPESIAAVGGIVLGVVGVGHKLLKLFGVGLPKEIKES